MLSIEVDIDAQDNNGVWWLWQKGTSLLKLLSHYSILGANAMIEDNNGVSARQKLVENQTLEVITYIVNRESIS